MPPRLRADMSLRSSRTFGSGGAFGPRGSTGTPSKRSPAQNGIYGMNELGNKAVADGTAGIKIADPKAAAKLLDLAIESARNRRRVIFFCACAIPAECHRWEVARLVLREAKKRG